MIARKPHSCEGRPSHSRQRDESRPDQNDTGGKIPASVEIVRTRLTAGLEIAQAQQERLLQAVRHPSQKAHGVGAINEPMVVGQ